MRRVSPVEPDGPRVFPEDSINHFRVQWTACLKPFAIIAHRPKEWSLKILAALCECEIVADTLCNLRVNGEASLLAAFTHDLQGIEAAVHVEVADCEARDLRATKSDLHANGENGPITNAEQRGWGPRSNRTLM